MLQRNGRSSTNNSKINKFENRLDLSIAHRVQNVMIKTELARLRIIAGTTSSGRWKDKNETVGFRNNVSFLRLTLFP